MAGVNPLVDDGDRRSKLLGGSDHAGVLPSARMRLQQQAEFLPALVLPDVNTLWIEFMRVVLRGVL